MSSPLELFVWVLAICLSIVAVGVTALITIAAIQALLSRNSDNSQKGADE